MTTTLKCKCSYCGETLIGEDAQWPDLDKSGNPVCSDCYFEHLQFECGLCCNYADVEEELAIGECFICSDDRFAPPGIYQITRHPFYAQPTIGMPQLFMDAVKLVRPGPWEGHFGGPCTAICKACRRRLRVRALRASRIRNVTRIHAR